jgi:membrane associated rhomboid family serine protease
MNPSDNLLIEGQFQGYWLTSGLGITRVISATFLHAGLGHLFGNLAFLFLARGMREHL